MAESYFALKAITILAVNVVGNRFNERRVDGLFELFLVLVLPRPVPKLGPFEIGHKSVPWCTTPIEAESSLGPDSHHPIISLSGIPSAVMVLRILHPILASTLCAANPLARIAEPTVAL